jgi:hypothetical protein
MLNHKKTFGSTFLVLGLLGSSIFGGGIDASQGSSRPRDDIRDETKEMFDSVEEGCLTWPKFERFKKRGADITAKVEGRSGLLHFPIPHRVAEYLMGNKLCDANEQSDRFGTPLHAAIRLLIDAITDGSGRWAFHEKMIKLLLSFGANPALQDAKGEIPIQILKDFIMEQSIVGQRSIPMNAGEKRLEVWIKRLSELEKYMAKYMPKEDFKASIVDEG